MRLLILNGPNLNLLGTREPDVYGATSLDDLKELTSDWAWTMGVKAEFEQSNSESHIIDLIQGYDGDGIVLNPGAFTHTSRAIPDAIRGIDLPVVEIHISDIRQREPWRAISLLSQACARTIYGRGIVGYRDAMRHLVNRADLSFQTVSYGPHPDNLGDLRLGGGSDLVVLAHGGLWKHAFERDTTESLAVDLAKRGYNTWNLEYRRLGDGGGWPGSAQDALTALDSIPQLETSADRVVVVSHSAGSQLMMWAAPRSRTPVAIHVALAPLLDLEAAVTHEDTGSRESAQLLSSGAPATVSPGDVPTVLVHGDADQIVPVERSVAFSHHHSLEHHRTSCDHFSLLSPDKAEWAWVVNRIGGAS